MASRIKELAVLRPQTVAAAGHVHSGWFHVADAQRILALLNVGDDGGGSIAVTFEQATSAAGADAKALDGGTWADAALGALTTNDTTTVLADGRPEVGLDVNNKFAYVSFIVTVTGGTGALVSGTIVGTDLQYDDHITS